MKEPAMSNHQPGDDERQDPAPHRAGAFDIRNVIAALFGFYGVVLIIMGLVADSPAQQAKTGGVNANLWAGIVMAIVAAGFVVWTRLRPVIIEQDQESMDDRPPN
jgi:hypothetical protein